MTMPIDPRSLRKRKNGEAQFKALSYMALSVAGIFLVIFFTDIVRQGYTAFQQTEIQAQVTFTQEIFDNPISALDPKISRLVSRGVTRVLPMQLRENPQLLGHTQTLWVLANAEVDQYVKGKANRLKPQETALVDELRAAGQIKKVFNTGFFANGDSKLPEMAGILSAAVGTVYLLAITFIFSFPAGVMAAIYLEEFAPDNRLMHIVEVNINNLAAIPSILFGLLGLAIFINFLGLPRSSALVGGLTLALMTLPVIIIATRAAIRAIPDSIRKGALALGATHWQVVWDHVLPLSLPGILTGTIIGLARAIGETAPLLIIGMVAYIQDMPRGLTSAATVLPAQIYVWSAESMRAFTERTSAGIIVLLAVLLSMNAIAILLRNKYERKW
ncbi:MAG: phosphate ABC transporter permease PstA [Desulfovibrionales bacterium]|nr:phosphate ABC transporter permease PstA [Desulfovibrionales bacterium]